MVGYDVKDVFVTCTPDQVRSIYIGIIEVLQQPHWSLKDIEHVVMDANPDFADYYENDSTAYKVERIARTELNRILMYAKEQLAIQDGELDKRYAWRGPLDERTTACCRFLQTGELTGLDRDGKPYDYEHLRDELPEWREDGWTLPELKQAVHDTWEVFHEHGIITTVMPSEWTMHINCRHSFQPISVIPEEAVRPVDMDGWIQPANVPDEVYGPTVITPYVPEGKPPVVYDTDAVPVPVGPAIHPDYGTFDIEGYGDTFDGDLSVLMDGSAVLADMTGSDEVYVDTHPYRVTFGIRFSVQGIPAYYVYEYDESDDPIYVLQTVDESDIYRYTSFIVNERDEGMSDYDIAWALRDEGMIGDDVNFLMDNAYDLMDLAYDRGWAYL